MEPNNNPDAPISVRMQGLLEHCKSAPDGMLDHIYKALLVMTQAADQPSAVAKMFELGGVPTSVVAMGLVALGLVQVLGPEKADAFEAEVKAMIAQTKAATPMFSQN
jgi:hypothetical protein